MGASGRAMLRAIIAGETDPLRLADLARRRLRLKHGALAEALYGRVTPHHRFLLERLLAQVEFLETEIHRFDQRVTEMSAPFAAALQRLDAIPGINRRLAENVLAEVGDDMAPFPSVPEMVSWAGICPGKRESAGVSHSARIRKGNRWLSRALVQAAWAARRKKNCYLATQFQRIARRRGAQRAVVAVAHSILTATFFILRDGVDYQDLGPEHFHRLSPDKVVRDLVKRLEKLGHRVTLEMIAA